MNFAFHVFSKKSFPNPKSTGFFPAFSSRIFTGLALSFRSMTHFKLIFVCSERFEVIFLLVDVQFQNHLLKAILSSLHYLVIFVENQLNIYVWVYFWMPYSIPLISVSILPLIYIRRQSCFLLIKTVLFSSFHFEWLSLLFLASLRWWLDSSVQCRINERKVNILALFPVLAGKHLVFHHYGVCCRFFRDTFISGRGSSCLFLTCWEFLSCVDVKFCQMLFLHPSR